jgi:thioredoxin reductase (NADPH)
MTARIAGLAASIVIAAIGLMLLVPRSSYQPGALLAAHQQLSSYCVACHRPWRGPSDAGCVNCHGDLENNPHSGTDALDQEVGLMGGRKLVVSSIGNLECLSCHGEHRGPDPNISVSSAFACAWCHEHPAINKVAEHEVPVMKREFFVRHVFKQRFNHYEHALLITSHYPPIPGGFSCTSCHLVPPVLPGEHERMSFKWSGCAGVGCHLVPQDSFMEMPAALGPSPVTIPYSGVFPMRHIKAVFVHSAGHLKSACEQCHFKVAASKDPDDRDSLAIERCFNCHTHQPPPPAESTEAQSAALPQTEGVAKIQLADLDPGSVAIGAQRSSAAAGATVVACGACHLFHAYGVVPTLDFNSTAPRFPPKRAKRFALIVYVPHWAHIPGGSQIGPLPLRRVVFAPWWLGLFAIGFVAWRFIRFVRNLPQEQLSHEAAPDVAPQRASVVPALDDTYQTSIRHLYIVGEAAGTASINLAMRSGRQVIEAIADELKHSPPPARLGLYDVVIIGCGPAGLGATATAKVLGLQYATLEKMTPASTLRSYPRAKFVQATPIDIAEYGSFFLEGDNSREELIREWEKIIAKLGLVINGREEVNDVVREQDYLVVKTAHGKSYPARCVVLAIGVRGNPRHLNLEGEVPARVGYTLIEPGEFTSRKILVVGGGNAGAETAQALAAAHLNNSVSYSFRSSVLTNVTRENADAIVALQKAKAISLYPATALAEIRAKSIILKPIRSTSQEDAQTSTAKPFEIDNDFIFAMIGAELPTGFLRAIGVKMVSKGRLYG